MERIVCCFFSAFLVILSTITTYAENEYQEYMPDVKAYDIISKDKKYRYGIDEHTQDAWFAESYEKYATILNIPAEIDGHQVVGVATTKSNSSYVVKLNYGKNIKYISPRSFLEEPNDKPCIPLCNVNYNDSLECICKHASLTGGSDRYTRVDEDIKLLRVPKSVKYIGRNGIARNCNMVVFDGSPILNYCALSFYLSYNDNNISVSSRKAVNRSCEIYFASDAFDVHKNAFNYETEINDHEDVPTYEICPNVTLYRKSGTADFDKFAKQGYTVKEYTDEWWKNIKEIQSVTLSGKGLQEKKDSAAHGTITNLGWSASNDPAQYLSHTYTLSMQSGEKVKLTSTFAPADAFDDRMFFVSLNEDVAQVDVDSGEIIALKKGAATVRCVAASGVFSDAVVYVDGATAADLPDDSAPAVTTANPTDPDKTVTAVTPDKAANGNTFMEKIKSISAKPAYIAVSACTLAAAAAVVVIKRKKK